MTHLIKRFNNGRRWYTSLDDYYASHLDCVVEGYPDYDYDVIMGDQVKSICSPKSEAISTEIKSLYQLTENDFQNLYPIYNISNTKKINDLPGFLLIAHRFYDANSVRYKVLFSYIPYIPDSAIDKNRRYFIDYTALYYFKFSELEQIDRADLIRYILIIGTEEQKDYIKSKIKQYYNVDFEVHCCFRNDEITKIITDYLSTDWQQKIDSLINNEVTLINF